MAAAREGGNELVNYEKKHAPEQAAEARKDIVTEYKELEEEVHILSFDFLKS